MQEVKLAPSQRNGLAAPRYLAPRRVNRHVTQRDRFVRPGTPGLRPTQVRPHARHEFSRFKGLRYVVVGAKFEAQHGVRHVVARGQHDDWHFRFAPNLAAHIPSRHPRQHEVEHDQRRSFTAKRLQRRGPIAGDDDPKAVAC